MNGQNQQPERSRIAEGVFVLHVLAAGTMTLTKWNIGKRAYSPALALAGFFAHGFLAAVVPAPAALAAVATPLWVYSYGALALAHLAKQQRNTRAGTMVHSAFVGELLTDAIPALRGDGLRKFIRNLLMVSWIGWWFIALPGVGLAIILGVGAEQLLLARTRMASEWVDQDMFDALGDAEMRQRRVEAMQQRR
jgi:hypothetical protein